MNCKLSFTEQPSGQTRVNLRLLPTPKERLERKKLKLKRHIGDIWERKLYVWKNSQEHKHHLTDCIAFNYQLIYKHSDKFETVIVIYDEQILETTPEFVKAFGTVKQFEELQIFVKLTDLQPSRQAELMRELDLKKMRNEAKQMQGVLF